MAPAFIFLLWSEPFLLFVTSCIGKKQLFNKVFDINYKLLTQNQFGENLDLSFEQPISSYCKDQQNVVIGVIECQNYLNDRDHPTNCRNFLGS